MCVRVFRFNNSIAYALTDLDRIQRAVHLFVSRFVIVHNNFIIRKQVRGKQASQPASEHGK